MGNRLNANTEETTTLGFQYRRNNVLVAPYAVTKVTIHHSLSDATGNLNIISTITSTGIIAVYTGCYSYVVPIIATAGTYYDKIFITPKVGVAQVTYINTFTITAPVYTGSVINVPSDPSLCRIIGRTIDSNNNVVGGLLVFCRPNIMPGTVQSSLISQDGVSTVSDVNGHFQIDLLRNTQFIITIKELGVHAVILVPDKDVYPIISLMSDISEPVIPPVTPGTPGSPGTSW